MARTADFYIERAITAFDAGFATKAAKNDAMAFIGRAYELHAETIQRICLDVLHGPERETPRGRAVDEVYFSIPHYLHQWRDKHATMVLAQFPELAAMVAQIADLVELRETMKAAEVTRRPARAQKSTLEVRAMQSLESLMALRKEQFATGLKIAEVFGTLPVTINSHWVTNEFGTSFLRTFWYLGGKLMPLNIICCIAQELADREKA